MQIIQILYVNKPTKEKEGQRWKSQFLLLICSNSLFTTYKHSWLSRYLLLLVRINDAKKETGKSLEEARRFNIPYKKNLLPSVRSKEKNHHRSNESFSFYQNQYWNVDKSSFRLNLAQEWHALFYFFSLFPICRKGDGLPLLIHK